MLMRAFVVAAHNNARLALRKFLPVLEHLRLLDLRAPPLAAAQGMAAPSSRAPRPRRACRNFLSPGVPRAGSCALFDGRSQAQRQGPITSAVLAAETGRDEGSISEPLRELERLGFIAEQAAAGRPSHPRARSTRRRRRGRDLVARFRPLSDFHAGTRLVPEGLLELIEDRTR